MDVRKLDFLNVSGNKYDTEIISLLPKNQKRVVINSRNGLFIYDMVKNECMKFGTSTYSSLYVHDDYIYAVDNQQKNIVKIKVQNDFLESKVKSIGEPLPFPIVDILKVIYVSNFFIFILKTGHLLIFTKKIFSQYKIDLRNLVYISKKMFVKSTENFAYYLFLIFYSDHFLSIHIVQNTLEVIIRRHIYPNDISCVSSVGEYIEGKFIIIFPHFYVKMAFDVDNIKILSKESENSTDSSLSSNEKKINISEFEHHLIYSENIPIEINDVSINDQNIVCYVIYAENQTVLCSVFSSLTLDGPFEFLGVKVINLFETSKDTGNLTVCPKIFSKTKRVWTFQYQEDLYLMILLSCSGTLHISTLNLVKIVVDNLKIEDTVVAMIEKNLTIEVGNLCFENYSQAMESYILNFENPKSNLYRCQVCFNNKNVDKAKSSVFIFLVKLIKSFETDCLKENDFLTITKDLISNGVFDKESCLFLLYEIIKGAIKEKLDISEKMNLMILCLICKPIMDDSILVLILKFQIEHINFDGNEYHALLLYKLMSTSIYKEAFINHYKVENIKNLDKTNFLNLSLNLFKNDSLVCLDFKDKYFGQIDDVCNHICEKSQEIEMKRNRFEFLSLILSLCRVDHYDYQNILIKFRKYVGRQLNLQKRIMEIYSKLEYIEKKKNKVETKENQQNFYIEYVDF